MDPSLEILSFPEHGALAFETVSFSQSEFPILAKSLQPCSRKFLIEFIFQYFSGKTGTAKTGIPEGFFQKSGSVSFKFYNFLTSCRKLAKSLDSSSLTLRYLQTNKQQ